MSTKERDAATGILERFGFGRSARGFAIPPPRPTLANAPDVEGLARYTREALRCWLESQGMAGLLAQARREIRDALFEAPGAVDAATLALAIRVPDDRAAFLTNLVLAELAGAGDVTTAADGVRLRPETAERIRSERTAAQEQESERIRKSMAAEVARQRRQLAAEAAEAERQDPIGFRNARTMGVTREFFHQHFVIGVNTRGVDVRCMHCSATPGANGLVRHDPQRCPLAPEPEHNAELPAPPPRRPLWARSRQEGGR